jgi:hypothetical protein
MPNPWDDLPDAPKAAPAERPPWADLPDAEAEPQQQAAPDAAAPLSESLARGGLQGASFGLSDELAAVPMALMHGDPLLGVTLDEPTFGERWSHALQILQRKNHAAQEANPRAYLAAEFGGGLAAPGGLAASRAAALPTWGARAASLAKSGFGSGALSGLGFSESRDPMERLRSAEVGGALGAVAMPVVSEGLRQIGTRLLAPLAETLAERAGAKLFNVAGGIQRDVRAVGGPERAVQTGLQGRDEGLVRWWDFLPGAPGRQAARVADFGEKATQQITEALDDIGARVKVAPLIRAVDNAAADIRDFAEVNPAGLAKVDGLIAALQRHAGRSPDGTVSARTLQTAKKAIDDIIKTWDPSGKSSLAQGLKQGLYRAVAEAQEEAAASSPFTAAPGLAKYKAGKEGAQLAINLEKLQASHAARDTNVLSRIGGLPGAMAGIAAIARGIESGDPSSALKIAALVRILASPRTHAAAALGGSAAASLPAKLLQSGVTPAAARSLMSALVGGKAQSGELAEMDQAEPNYGIGTIEEYLAQQARERGLGLAQPSMALR